MKSIKFGALVVFFVFLSYVHVSGVIISERLASVVKTKLPSDKVEVFLSPAPGGKAEDIDTSFFVAHNIPYMKGGKDLEFLIALIPVNLISELESIHGLEFADIMDPIVPYKL